MPNRRPEPDAGADALPDLRLRIADRAPAATNPLVRFAATVLDLACDRLEAGTVRELVAMPVVRRLFGFDEETADAIAAVIEDTNVRWGLDADHRARWDAGRVGDHTWRRGLDRALSGVFYADSSVRVVGAIAPLDGGRGAGGIADRAIGPDHGPDRHGPGASRRASALLRVGPGHRRGRPAPGGARLGRPVAVGPAGAPARGELPGGGDRR